MKKIILSLLFIVWICNIKAQSNLKIGVVEFDSVLAEMPGMEKAKSVLQRYQRVLTDTMDVMNAEFESKYLDYQTRVSTMSDLIKQTKEKELSDLHDSIDVFRQKAQDRLQNKQQELVQPFIEKGKLSIKQIADQYGYNCILNLSENVILYKSNDLDDIKQFVLAGLENSSINVNLMHSSIVNRIGYLDFTTLLASMPGIESVKTDLQKYQKTLIDQLDGMKAEFESKYLDYQSQTSSMSDLIKQTKENELSNLQGRIDAFEQKASQDLQARQQELVAPFIKKAKTAIQEVATENGFSIIFNNIADVFLYFSNRTYDMLDIVKAKLKIEVSHSTNSPIQSYNYKGGLLNFNIALQKEAGIELVKTTVQDYQKTLNDSLDDMKAEFDKKYLEYKSLTSSMSDLIKQRKEKELSDLQNNIDTYKEQLTQKIEAKQSELMSPIINSLREHIADLCRNNNIDVAINNIYDDVIFSDNSLIDLSELLKGNALPESNKVVSQSVPSKKVVLPPMISIQDITFSNSILNAGETGTLTITLKNTGMGDAKGVMVNLKGGTQGVSFPNESVVPTIQKEGGLQTIQIEIKASLNVLSSDAEIFVEIIEPNYKIKIPGKQLSFKVAEFIKPELILAKFAVVEMRSPNPNNQIDINEQIGLKFVVQNIGQGIAENVKMSVVNNQKGVIFLGVEESTGEMVSQNPYFISIPSGKFETVTYSYFVNSEFSENELTFLINGKEKYEKFGFSQTRSVPINKTIKEEGYIRTIANNAPKIPMEKVIIQDVPDFEVDVDVNIPKNPVSNPNTFAVIIGNENYSNEIGVPFAKNDALTFKQYATRTLGIDDKNIRLLQDATFGQIINVIDWITSVIKAYEGQARVLFYYAGHGMPDYVNKTAYLLPVDGISTNMKTAIKIEDLYAKLAEFPSKSVIVFLDACFSGASRDGMLAKGRGVRIKPKEETIPGNIIVFSATTGDETAYPLKEKKHGLFTYYVLKELQESKGKSSYKELYDYVKRNVNQQSIIYNDKSQNPQIIFNSESQNSWESLKFYY